MAYPANDSNSNAFQCLFIQINLDRGGFNRECRMIQIFSKQASLMANLINHFTANLPSRDVPDSGSFREDQFASTRPVDGNAIKELHRFSCATFNVKGECVKQQGSFRTVV